MAPAAARQHWMAGEELRLQGRLEPALDRFEQALAIDPGFADAHFGRGRAMLAQGQFAAGWASHEWRWGIRTFVQSQPRQPRALWEGLPLHGERVLLFAEQGPSETLQYLRYTPMIATAGGEAVLEVQPELVRLLQACPALPPIVAQGGPPPQHDVDFPLLSLAALQGGDPTTVPAPQLPVDEAWRTPWAGRFAPAARRKVGLAWSEDPAEGRAGAKLPAAALRPLLEVPGIQWCTLQPGAAQAGLLDDAPEGALLDLGPEIEDLAAMAGLIAELDLVISMDAAPAHLAGAVGQAAWVMLPAVTHWRWLLDRSDTPWYPTMRLFRQQPGHAWSETVEAVVGALSLLR